MAYRLERQDSRDCWAGTEQWMTGIAKEKEADTVRGTVPQWELQKARKLRLGK